MTLEWVPSEGRGRTVYAYRVYMQTGGEGPFLEYDMGEYDIKFLTKLKNGYSLRIKDLEPGIKYAFQIAAVNTVGVGPRTNGTNVTSTALTGAMFLGSRVCL